MPKKRPKSAYRPNLILTTTLFLAFCGACNSPPKVTITTPQDGEVFTDSPITVSGTITDNGAIKSATLTNNGTAYTLTLGAGGAFSKDVSLDPDSNEIVVTGVDTYNAKGTASTTVGYAAPVAIQITSPPDGATVNSNEVTVKGTVSSSNTVLIVNGIRAVVEGGAFSAYGVPLVPGDNSIAAVARHPTYKIVVGTAFESIHTADAKQTVKLSASVFHGVPPVGVDFSLTLNTDNPIVNYKWDLNADGIWEIDSPSQNAASNTYTEARLYRPRVLITDSQGVSFSDTVSLNVHGPAEAVGSFASGQPSDIVRKDDGTFLVLDSASCTVTGYDADGAPTGLSFGSCGTGEGQFLSPMGLALNPNTGAIYVADTGNNRVEKFDAQGNFAFFFSNWTCGSSTGPFNQPYGITVDSSNRIYVIDRGNGRMMSFDNDFCDCALGTPTGFFTDPRRVEVDGRGHFYIIGNGFYNQGIGSVNVYTTAGQYVKTLNATTGLPLAEPYDLLVENGRIYIADSGVGKVLILNDDLENLRIENEATGVASAPLAIVLGTRAAMDTFLAADSSGVVEGELPADSPVPVWDAMKARLVAADFQGALAYICEESRAGYERTFNELADRIPEVAATWEPTTPESLYGETATYFSQEQETWDGTPRMVGHSIVFTRDTQGRWCIMGF